MISFSNKHVKLTIEIGLLLNVSFQMSYCMPSKVEKFTNKFLLLHLNAAKNYNLFILIWGYFTKLLYLIISKRQWLVSTIHEVFKKISILNKPLQVDTNIFGKRYFLSTSVIIFEQLTTQEENSYLFLDLDFWTY